MAKEKADVIEITDKKLVGNIDQNIADLETVIEGITYPLTISINGEWGAGKTVFLKEWANKKPESSIYIDAFATDFTDNPLAVILSEFSNYFKNEPLFKKLSEKKIDFENITKAGFAELVKMLTASVIDLNSATKESPLNDKIDDLRKINNAILEFKKVISKTQTNKEKLYVFIDELDRCRPTYAVEFIEIVKHFFEIDNTVFVFAINRKELVSSIKHVQGCADEDRYLKKFFNLNFDLPPLPTIEFIELLINDDEKTLGLDKEYFDNEFIGTLLFLSNSFGLKPRDIEQLFINIALAIKKHNNHNIKALIYPLTLLAILREDNRTKEIYKNLKDSNGISQTIYDDIFQKCFGNNYKKPDGLGIEFFKIWVEIISLKRSQLSKHLNELYESTEEEVEEINNFRETEESIFLREKIRYIRNTTSEMSQIFGDIGNNYSLIEYIDSLLNFSNQFTKQDPETSSG